MLYAIRAVLKLLKGIGDIDDPSQLISFAQAVLVLTSHLARWLFGLAIWAKPVMQGA